MKYILALTLILSISAKAQQKTDTTKWKIGPTINEASGMICIKEKDVPICPFRFDVKKDTIFMQLHEGFVPYFKKAEYINIDGKIFTAVEQGFSTIKFEKLFKSN